jgi:predicted CXXCH cytochrome family protein
MKEIHMNDERLLVLVCWECHKLIGTRENYWMRIEKGKQYAICEGCHHDIFNGT